MNQELPIFWQELVRDLSKPAALWQLVIVIVACLTAWALNGVLSTYVMRNAPEKWKLVIGSINRVLFPLTSLILIELSKFAIAHWHHTSLLHLAITLLFVMALIRLAVYALRYIVSPGGLLKTLESSISGTIWILLALHLSGILPQILQVLESVKFNIGKNPVDLLLIIQAIITIFVTIIIALWFSRFIENKIMGNEHVNVNLRVVLTKLLRIMLIFVAILISLSAVGLDITLLSVFGGALGVGLGFGLQRIASNYVSGFIILTDKSMQIGDAITIDKNYGVIKDLRSRYMLLEKLDGTHVIIPNESLITTSVVNHSLLEHKGRVQVNISISLNSNLELALELMHAAAMQQERVLMKPAPDVLVKGFTETGIDLALGVWVMFPETGASGLQSSLYLVLWQSFKKNGIKFAQSEASKLIEMQIGKE